MASRPIVSPIAIAAAAPLAHDHAGVHELLQVVAGVLLRELELAVNSQTHTGARARASMFRIFSRCLSATERKRRSSSIASGSSSDEPARGWSSRVEYDAQGFFVDSRGWRKVWRRSVLSAEADAEERRFSAPAYWQ
jgi:hypothetical protein